MFKRVLNYALPALTLLFLIFACKDIPDSGVWPPDTSNDHIRPIITKVYPDPMSMDKDSIAFAGVGILYIEGEKFSPNPQDNRVYFNGELGEVQASTPTLITVKIPNVVGDSIKIHVSVKGLLQFAKYKDQDYYGPFRTKSVVTPYKAIDKFVDASGLAVDENENVYVLTTGKQILKLSYPDSTAQVWATSTFITTPCMRMGPDSMLYVTRGIKSLYRVAEGGKTTKFASAQTKVSHIDFDINKNLFAGGKGGTIDCIKPDNSAATVADYSGYIITSLRVYDGYVYVSAVYDGDDSTAVQEGIWKNQILDADGNLGANELVIDWTDLMGKEGPSIQSITFNENGEMLIGLDKENAIYMLNSGTYFYYEVLSPPATLLTYGNQYYLYINHRPEVAEDRAILRVEVSTKGAIYYGRQ